MISILHISYELRDRKNRKITTAVNNLIKNSLTFSNARIIDLMRVTSFKEEKIQIDQRGHLIVNAFGLPYGILLKNHLTRALDFVSAAEEQNLISFRDIDAIHAHKVTFEGYLGYHIHRKLNIPLFLTLRNTDFKVFRYRPDLHPMAKEILQSASNIFYLVPSMLTLLRKHFGREFFERSLRHKLVHLPNIIIRDFNPEVNPKQDPYFFTAMGLTKKDVKGKNLKRLLKAVAEIKNLQINLKLAGRGDYEWKVKKWTRNFKLEDKVEFLGFINNADIDKYHAAAAAFVLPSLSESFGMVYAEALFNGTPILCSKGVVGFEGFFNNVGVAVNPYSVNDIKKGLVELITNNSFYRNEIIHLKNTGAFSIFDPKNITRKYQQVMTDVLPVMCSEFSYEH